MPIHIRQIIGLETAATSGDSSVSAMLLSSRPMIHSMISVELNEELLILIYWCSVCLGLGRADKVTRIPVYGSVHTVQNNASVCFVWYANLI